ncbi:MAG: hypothetical protein KGD59_04510 [Candidatus Heimdallarchaeota archaeon]|nr:hypothetical protein [Candidatus Heimdallarchaeota archaeon]MBY8993789.1 hypothetical protein [Candidatus Heimdallarchaeota archaeon]
MSVLRQKRLNQFTFLIIIFVINSMFISSVNADYNIKEGDAYRFDISILRTPWDFPYNLHIGDIVITEGEKMVVKFTLVDPPYIKFSITINGQTESTTVFSNILVQDRNWADLTEEYEALGYNITETSDVWSLSQHNSTIVEAEYSKRNGILKRFYAFNESQLISVLNAGEIELIRLTEDSISYNWAYSFLAILPLTVLVVFLIKSNKFPKAKSTKKAALKEILYQQSASSDELPIGFTEETTTIVNGRKVKIRKTLVMTPDGIKWEVTNLKTNETWFVDK